MMPNRQVAIAGTVLKMPSGSQVLPPLQTCVPITFPFSTRLSMYSQKLPCGSRAARAAAEQRPHDHQHPIPAQQRRNGR